MKDKRSPYGLFLKDASTVRTTIELLKLVGYEIERRGLVGEIWKKIETF